MTNKLQLKRYRTTSGEEWLCIGFDHYDGTHKDLLLPREKALNQRELRQALQAAGAVGIEGDLNISELEDELGCKAGILATGTGWHGRSFVVAPGLIIGNDDVAFHPALVDRPNFPCQRGSLEDWQRMVAKPALDSDDVAFSILHALAAPLYKFSRLKLQEGAVFHFWAKSSSGKTTAIKAAISVSRSPDQLTSWDTTDRGLQELAASQNCLQVVLDDTEKIDASKKWRHLQEGVHRLTGGRGRTYSSIVKNSLPDLIFDGWAISNGPHSMEKIFCDGGQTRTDGDRVRMIDVRIPSPKKGGIWHQSPKLRGARAARASERLSGACRDQHGTALVAWVEFLVAKQESVEARVSGLIDEFVEKWCPNQGAVERRIAQKFGLIFATGRLATKGGVLPWSAKESDRLVARLYRRARRTPQEGMTIADAAGLIWEASRDRKIYPRFEVEKPVSLSRKAFGFVSKIKGKKQLFVRKDRVAELLQQRCERILDQMCGEGIVLRGQGGKRTVQLRVNIAGKTIKARFVAFDLKALKKATNTMRDTP